MAKLNYVKASKCFRLAEEQQLINGVDRASYPWFSLTNNVLDGSYHPMAEGVSETYEVGWWSEQASDDDGYFTEPPTIEAQIPKQALFNVIIHCDEESGNFIAEADIEFYSNTTLVRTDQIRDNTEVVLDHLVRLDDITKFIIKVKKVNHPNDQIRIIELETLVEDEVIDRLMDAPVRQIYAKVNVQFLDPFKKYSSEISSDDNMKFTFVSQLSDDIIYPTQKWFALTANQLDGSFHPLPKIPDSDLQVGWWSKEVSDAKGYFKKPPTIDVDMSEQPIVSLNFIGDVLTENYPVDFDVVMYRGEEIVKTEKIRNNQNVRFARLFFMDRVTKFQIVFLRGSCPGDSLRLYEIGTTIDYTYAADKLMSLHVYEELSYETNGLPVGAVSSNEFSMVIDNTDHMIDVVDPNSPFRTLLTKNRKMDVFFGVELYPGYIKWYKQGTFYSTKWNVAEDKNSVSCRALDVLNLLLDYTYYNDEIYRNKNLYELFELVLSSFEPLKLEYSIDESLKEIVIPYAWFGKGNYRKALQRLAEAATVVVYVDRNNVIKVHEPDTTVDSTYTFTDEGNILGREYINMWKTKVNSVPVKASIYDFTKGQKIYDNTTPTYVDPNSSIKLTIQYSAEPAENVVIKPTVDSGLKYKIDGIYTWGAELTLTNPTGTKLAMTECTATGDVLSEVASQIVEARDENSIKLDGMLKSKMYTCDLIQTGSYAKRFAESVLANVVSGRMDIVMKARGHIALGLGTKVDIRNSRDDEQHAHVLTKIQSNWDGALDATVTAHRI